MVESSKKKMMDLRRELSNHVYTFTFKITSILKLSESDYQLLVMPIGEINNVSTKNRPWLEESFFWLQYSYLYRLWLRVMESQEKFLSLFSHIHQSSRLIKYEPDARTFLGLYSSVTNYCQDLTIIVDNFSGNLSLNPTKQDIVFSEQANGQIQKPLFVDKSDNQLILQSRAGRF